MSIEDFVPVFIVGSPRSGTTLMSKILSSDPNFAIYNAETLLLNVCKAKYGDVFSSSKNRERFLNDWYQSRQFKESRLTQNEFKDIIDKSHSYENLLINFLFAIASSSNTNYIVDSTPANAAYIKTIHKEFPNAKFINMIRDGRDVSISQAKLGWSNPPYPYKSYNDRLHYAFVQWEEVLGCIEKQQKSINMLRIKYEDVLNNPEKFRSKVQNFLGLPQAEFDISLIYREESANSAFGAIAAKGANSPIGRWKQLDKAQLNNMSYSISNELCEYGYSSSKEKSTARLLFRYLFFRAHIKAKRVLIQVPGIARLSSTSLEIAEK